MTAVVPMAAILHGTQILLSGAKEGEGARGRTVGRRYWKVGWRVRKGGG